MTLTTEWEREFYRSQAFYLGADAGASVAAVLTGDEASEIVARMVAPSVYVRRPDLSGEWADDLTADSLTDSLRTWGESETEQNDRAAMLTELVECWDSGVDMTFDDTVRAQAHRTLGRTDRALNLERAVEDNMTRARQSAELAQRRAKRVPVMRDQVRAGAALLDTYAADIGDIPVRWRELVDVASLDMGSATRSVLGQVWGKAQGSDLPEGERLDYYAACHDLHLHLPNGYARAHKAFLAPLGDGSGAVTLKELWTEHLT